ncbi:hypothetical protein AWZ03_008831 [Drosophila navojoa]|uniref:Nucleoporin NUP42 n=1 Tax=Drosophila navojoa TaxID=7232 RepID=A0A484BAI4_DRONA|nr:mediator of RNA polymerase II transcription subunit 15-like [Drosophila navojoa]TDG44775.1 hypothetical protein AWZ03_008831 [Drosophila navojoa]
MGVCRFFQQGSCRFGAKCHNEHFDFKQYLKTDIEASINGKMWPLSVYGPFKDKPNIPNFIEDQSFEEVRFQAYESQRQNCFDQFHQQFTKEVHDATMKMKLMLQFPPQVIDVMIKLYETPEGVQPATNNNNPFAAQSSSIFSKPALSSASSNIFGGGSTVTTSFGSAGNSIFGGSSNAGNNIFASAQNTNIFTQQSQTQTFAGQQQQQPSLFGQQQPLGQAQASIFGQPQQQQPQPNPFGQAQAPVSNNNSVFGQPQPTNATPFGQSVAFAPQQQQQQQQQQPFMGGMFTKPQPVTANTGNIFAQAAAQPSSGFFTQPAGGFQQQQQMQSDSTQQMQQQQQQLQQPGTTSSVYSRMEDLTAEEIEAFKAEQFAPGKVPFKPPPRELC